MTLKQKLKAKELTIGSWISIGNTAVAEIMAGAGFDWLVIDMEHTAFDAYQCQELIRVIDLCGIPALVRVGDNNPLLIKRAMDAGADGVIVPMVNSKADALRAVSAVKYPPYGTRGVGLSRAQGYGITFNEYKNWLEKESIVIAQIEHIEAVKNIKQILSVDGIDGFMVGPYDLSGSLNTPGDFSTKGMKEALKKIGHAVDAKINSAGFHVVYPDVKLLEEKIKEGYTFLAFGTDFYFLGECCRNKLKEVKAGAVYSKKK